MSSLEMNAHIDEQRNIHLAEKYRSLYGKTAHLIVVVPDEYDRNKLDPMQFHNTLAWPVDGMEYQQEMRREWMKLN